MKFLGRQRELALLRDWNERWDRSFLTVLYGRRRVGKTRLVREAFAEAELLTFEGIEGETSVVQKRSFLERLAELSGRSILATARTGSWREILIALSDFIVERYGDRPVVVLFDEFQWMACGRTSLVSNLKYVWDNYLGRRGRVHLILCGSICSFLVRQVMRSKALYGRVDLEIALKPLRLPEIVDVFHPPRSLKEVTELYMTLGGIPRYLEMVDPTMSTASNLERLCFMASGLLVGEFERIFTSHFGANEAYRSLVATLAGRGRMERSELAAACKMAPSGNLTRYLEDLALAGFIEYDVPVTKPRAQKNGRWRLLDPYLRFYFRFIRDHLGAIEHGTGSRGMGSLVSGSRLAAWRGLAFERCCLQHHEELARALGFSAVRYDVGPWFGRGHDERAQIDLLFCRADGVWTLCEAKFTDDPVGRDIVADVERKVAALPNPRHRTIERVLITAAPPTSDLETSGDFNRILRLEDLCGLR